MVMCVNGCVCICVTVMNLCCVCTGAFYMSGSIEEVKETAAKMI